MGLNFYTKENITFLHLLKKIFSLSKKHFFYDC